MSKDIPSLYTDPSIHDGIKSGKTYLRNLHKLGKAVRVLLETDADIEDTDILKIVKFEREKLDMQHGILARHKGEI